jgi:hypothetical protein
MGENDHLCHKFPQRPEGHAGVNRPAWRSVPEQPRSHRSATNGRERHGNVRANSREFDRFNNLEQATWNNLPRSDVENIVRALRITQFAQIYAIIARLS